MGSSDAEVIYRPESENSYKFWDSYRLFFVHLYSSSGLIYQLYKRDFLASHRRSFLSFLWIFLSPLFGVMSWLFLNYAGVLKPGDVGVPYAVYILIGSSIFGYWIACYSAATQTLSAGSAFINQIKYPHEALLVKQILQPLTNFLISFSFNLVVAIVFLGLEVRWTIIAFPLMILPLTLLAVSLGLLMSLVTVVVADLGSVASTLIGFTIYLSPILFSPDAGPPLIKKVMDYNPLTHLICTPRDWVLYERAYNLNSFLLTSGGVFVIFMLVVRLFIVAERKLIEKMA